MANEVLQKVGTPHVWANGGDYGGGDRTDQINLIGLADGASRQGDKGNLGTPRARQYILDVWLEFAVAPASGTTVDIYWAASPHVVPATNNPGGCSGSDGAYTGTAGDSMDDSLNQLQFLGSCVLTLDATAVVQRFTFLVTLPHQYGMPVVDNNAGQALHSDAVEMALRFTGLIDEIQ
jgi:hypothetical protein